MLLTLLGMGCAYAAVDRKCYVELENGVNVVLQGAIPDNQKPEIVFKEKGFEVDGQVLMVSKVLECQPVDRPFTLESARKQEKEQPR
ncbi:type IVa secretion system protein TapY2 [Aeromonas sp. MdU4]|uniref:type IVa secretion system protein TapY2 n=1 Tax=Aeromonas sp. MdU4 TaxID=3342819 RepID=UPI0035BA1DAD